MRDKFYGAELDDAILVFKEDEESLRFLVYNYVFFRVSKKN